MAEQTTIAVVGATGSQGGGLVLRPWPTRTTSSGLRTDPRRTVGEGPRTGGGRRRGGGGGPGRPRRLAFRVRGCRQGLRGDELLGAAHPGAGGREDTRRHGTRAGGQRRGRGAAGRYRPRRVVDVGGHQRSLRRQRPRAERGRPLQGAALRRQGRGGRAVRRARRPHDVSTHHDVLRGIRGGDGSVTRRRGQGGAEDPGRRPTPVVHRGGRHRQGRRWESSSAATSSSDKP